MALDSKRLSLIEETINKRTNCLKKYSRYEETLSELNKVLLERQDWTRKHERISNKVRITCSKSKMVFGGLVVAGFLLWPIIGKTLFSKSLQGSMYAGVIYFGSYVVQKLLDSNSRGKIEKAVTKFTRAKLSLRISIKEFGVAAKNFVDSTSNKKLIEIVEYLKIKYVENEELSRFFGVFELNNKELSTKLTLLVEKAKDEKIAREVRNLMNFDQVVDSVANNNNGRFDAFSVLNSYFRFTSTTRFKAKIVELKKILGKEVELKRMFCEVFYYGSDRQVDLKTDTGLNYWQERYGVAAPRRVGSNLKFMNFASSPGTRLFTSQKVM